VKNVKKINLATVLAFALSASMLVAKLGIGYGFSKGHF
jgi:hypothetical protein